MAHRHGHPAGWAQRAGGCDARGARAVYAVDPPAVRGPRGGFAVPAPRVI